MVYVIHHFYLLAIYFSEDVFFPVLIQSGKCHYLF